MSPSTSSTVANRETRVTSARRHIGTAWQRLGIGFALGIIVIAFSLASDNFLSRANLQNIGTQITINTILAAGMMFVILVAGIDLSVGASVALCAVVAAKVLQADIHPALAIIGATLVSCVIGVLVGTTNGLISERWRVPSFIVTLGMMSVARGAALEISDSRTTFGFPEAFTNFGTGSLLGVPFIFMVALATVAVGWFVLTRTPFGRTLYAIGNSREAVRLAGHRVGVNSVLAFSIMGLAVGIASIVYMARLNIASPILGSGFELEAIAAVIIGGTSLSGGKGSMVGTLLGAVLLGVLTNGLILVGIGDNVRLMITGSIIVGAIILDSYRSRRPAANLAGGSSGS